LSKIKQFLFLCWISQTIVATAIMLDRVLVKLHGFKFSGLGVTKHKQ